MKNSTRFVLVASFAAGIALLSGCAGQKDSGAPMGAMNTKCPYTGGAANPDLTSEFNGQQVAFCCGGCKNRFDKSTDDARAELMKKVATK
jgi:hypothetical protein